MFSRWDKKSHSSSMIDEFSDCNLTVRALFLYMAYKTVYYNFEVYSSLFKIFYDSDTSSHEGKKSYLQIEKKVTFATLDKIT